MSIYGRRVGVLDFDRVDGVTPTAPTTPAPASRPRDHADTMASDDAYTSVRKAIPANHLLPATLHWLRGLPEHIAPHALVTQFPRILNLMAMQWQDRHRCPMYFDELLVDRRGGRRGFAREVRDEIQALHDFWYHRHV